MALEPLINASAAIQIHVVAAAGALALGVVQFCLPRGSASHRMTGRWWVFLMAVIALSSFFIHEIRLIGRWSPIHLLSVFTLVMLVVGVVAIRRGKRRLHQYTMISLFVFALMGAGAFTLLPGRLMHQVLIGG